MTESSYINVHSAEQLEAMVSSGSNTTNTTTNDERLTPPMTTSNTTTGTNQPHNSEESKKAKCKDRWGEITDYLYRKNVFNRKHKKNATDLAVGAVILSDNVDSDESNHLDNAGEEEESQGVIRLEKGHIWEKEYRSEVFRAIRVVCITILVVLGLAATLTVLLYGVTWNPVRFYKNIPVVILNRDNGTFTASPSGIPFPSFSQLLVQTLLSTRALKYTLMTQLDNPVKYVQDGKTYAVIEIPYNFSSRLSASLFSGDPLIFNSYVPSNNSIRNIFDEGRASSVAVVIRRTVNATLAALSTNVTTTLLTTDPLIATRASIPAIVQPYYLQEVNLHPVRFAGQDVLGGLGLLYLFIVATGLVNAAIGGWGSLMLKVKGWQMFIIRTIQALIGSALVALTVVTIVICFGSISVYEKGWALYFLFLWLVVLTFFLAAALIIALFGPYANFIIPVFLFLNYTSSGGAVATVLSPRFYRIGYALPMFNAIQGARFLIYGSYNRIGLNIGVLVAWVVACYVLTWSVHFFKLNLMIYKTTPKEAQEAFEDVGNTVFTSNTTILASAGEDIEVSEMRARRSIDQELTKAIRKRSLSMQAPQEPQQPAIPPL